MGAGVTDQFSIDVSWLPDCHGPTEFRRTAASLQIDVGGKIATRVDDDWSKSVQQSTRVSAYPLALWLASSWWRLRWESPPFKNAPDTSWRMSHEMPGAGHGYLWPLVTFESDGEEISTVCRPSNPLSTEPVRYLGDFREAISATVFEKTLDQFVNLVLARLDACGVSGSQLHELWGEIVAERVNPALARSRKLEACLGFDPDEAPQNLMDRLDLLSQEAGPQAVDELAPVCSGSQHNRILNDIEAFSSLPGVIASASVSGQLASQDIALTAPWKRGWSLASQVRQSQGLNLNPVSDSQLADVLGIPAAFFQKANGVGSRPPLGLAVRDSGGDRFKLLFRKRNRPALRFEAARFLSEQLLAPQGESWLPVTDTSTARQKAQRAFAAEFLCPIEALREFLDADFSSEAIEDAGDHFGVSELAVKSVLANHHEIPFEWVAA